MLLFRALASGSSGNAYLLRSGKSTLLIEAGLPLSKLRTHLAAEELSPEDLTGVLVSHEHADHCAAARDLGELYGIPIWANDKVLRAAHLHDLPCSAILPVGQPVLLGDVHITSFPVSHDAVCPVGFLIRAGQRTIAIATDLGHPTPEVAEAVRLADLVVLEANHDSEMLRQSRYPPYLRRRIAGPDGHLSNTQAAGVLVDHVKGDDVEVWLAHLSRNNNTPGLAQKTVQRALRAMGLGGVALGVALRDRPSLRWTGLPRPRQLSLFPAEVG